MGRPAISIPSHIIAALGTTPDNKLAKIAKCSTAKIYQLRKERGIPPYEVNKFKAQMTGNSPPTMPTTWEAVAAHVSAEMNTSVTKSAEVQVRLPEAVKRLFTEGKHTAGGVLIPFEVFAAAAMEAMR